jgi:hypothetical protein
LARAVNDVALGLVTAVVAFQARSVMISAPILTAPAGGD